MNKYLVVLGFHFPKKYTAKFEAFCKGVPKRRICLFNKHQNKLGNQTFDIKTNKWMKNKPYFSLYSCNPCQEWANKPIRLKTNHFLNICYTHYN